MKQGRLTSSDLDKAGDSRGLFERGHDGVPENAPPMQPPPPVTPPDPRFAAFDEDVEAQLKIYFDRAREPKQKGSHPIDTLAARLGEFSAPPPHAEPFKDAESVAPLRQERTSPPAPRASDLEWFELRFQELKAMLARRNSDTSEIVSINLKLAEIIGRVDRLSAALPGEKTMAAVETQLASLSRSLEQTRAQSASDANRIARAAREILAATEGTEKTRAGFEDAARQTVAVSGARAAGVTADEVTAALKQRRDGRRFQRMETELRTLTTLSRKNSDRTAAALERIQESLRVVLERSPHEQSAASPRKRAAVHTPITTDADEYRIGDDFGAEHKRKPRLDAITLRREPPPDPNFLDAIKQASEKLIAKQGRRSGSGKEGSETAAPSPEAASRDEDRSLPLWGLGIVGLVLLMASAALYYLHMRAQPSPFHATLAPDMQLVRPLPEPQWSPQRGEAASGKAAVGVPKSAPSLFTAAGQNHEPSPSREDPPEDLQILAGAASRGDRDAQFRIAARFLSDGPLQKDPNTAARWLARAADQGHVESQFVLASLYERGVGVPKDETMARDLYRKASGAGHIRAMHNLGVLLCGQDTPQDYREAAAWFASAAMSGLTDSQFNLAVLYERGLGLQQSNQKAYFWYEVASLAGDKEATRQAERLKRELSDDETQAAAEQAGSWRPSIERLPGLANGSNASSQLSDARTSH